MIRALIMTLVLLVVLCVGGLYAAYGQIEPCRALAVERARTSVVPTGLAEPFTRMDTSQMASTECARGLLESWWGRIRRAL
ncbi:MAG: hypothetical protein KGI68_09360 [Alphaproteobacteria bacterium]|nr:hypothetical protein [Alphaproteobacteria bacterium]MDE1985041.1 hypothetical protein [Alphaproteobacteria bacterium]MDE2498726.1 hypothetical protein [Alphaproteobacteria bacterium]